MYFFAPDHNIDLFYPSHITSAQKETGFSFKLKQSKMGAKTREDYCNAFFAFVKKLMKVQEMRTDMTLNSDLSSIADKVNQLQDRNQKEINAKKKMSCS